MKKIFRIAALALVALSLTVACNNKTQEEPLDSMPIEEAPVAEPVIEEPMEDTTAVAEEQTGPATKPTVTKKKKSSTTAATKAEEKKDDSEVKNATAIQKNDNSEATGTTIKTNGPKRKKSN